VSTIEKSEFGYWIRPDGRAIPMDALQVHGKWIIANGIYDRTFAEPTDATEQAVLDGWIGVSLSPIGTSLGIRVRKEAVTKRAASTLRDVVSKVGFLRKECYTDIITEINGTPEYRTGLGKDLAGLIMTACWDDEANPDPETDVEALAARVNRMRHTGAMREWGLAAMDAGALPDVGAMREELKAFDAIRQRVSHAVYAWSERGYSASVNGDSDYLRNTLRDVRQQVLHGAAEMEAAVERTRAAFYGIPLPLPTDLPSRWEPVPALVSGESPLLALTRLATIDAEMSAAVRTMPNPIETAPESLKEAMKVVDRHLAALAVPAASLKGHIKRLDEAVAQTDQSDLKALRQAMSYYFGHECGRSTSGHIPSRDMSQALSNLRLAVIALEHNQAPSP